MFVSLSFSLFRFLKKEKTETPPPPPTLMTSKAEHDVNIINERVVENMFLSTQHLSTRLYRLIE